VVGSAAASKMRGLTIPGSTIAWTNEDALGNISLSHDLTVTWSNATVGGLVAIDGSSADPKKGAGASFQCIASADVGSFAVPEWVLSALPASGAEGYPWDSLRSARRS
jgi:hypothetical protein